MRSLGAALAEARRGLRLRRRGALLTAVGIALAAAMLAAAVVVGEGLGGGFDRAARAADLPDVIVRFDPQSARLVGDRITALPDVASYSTRFELTNVGIAAGGRRRGDAVAEVMSGPGRPGYAVVAGHNLSPRGSQVLIELGFAQAWHIRLGSTFFISDLGPQRVVGFVQAPRQRGIPAREAPLLHLAAGDRRAVRPRRESPGQPRRDLAPQLRLPERGSRPGAGQQLRPAQHPVRDQVGRADPARSGGRDRHRPARRAVCDRAGDRERDAGRVGPGRSPAAAGRDRRAARGGRPARPRRPFAGTGSDDDRGAGGRGGLAAGVLATYGADNCLLTMLNEPPPGGALVVPLAAGWLASVAIPVLGAAWPAWRAAGRSPVGLLRGGELQTGTRRRRSMGPGRGGLASLGARLVAARRVRLAATVVTLGLSTGFVLLMLALASALSALETDPGALGKRYQLTASTPVAMVPTALTQALAVGNRALWDLPHGLSLPSGVRAQAAASPDGPPNPGLVQSFLTQALAGPTVTVPADPARWEMTLPQVVEALAGAGSWAGGGPAVLGAAAGGRLDYVLDVGPQLRLIVLDLVRRDGGSGGLVVPGQDSWLAGQLAAAAQRWVIVVSHQPIQSSAGGVALETWMLDHVFPGSLGEISRQLSFIDAQGGETGGLRRVAARSQHQALSPRRVRRQISRGSALEE